MDRRPGSGAMGGASYCLSSGDETRFGGRSDGFTYFAAKAGFRLDLKALTPSS